MQELLFTDNLQFYTFVYENNHHTDKFRPSPTHYCSYMVRGTGKIVSGDVTLELAPGDLFYTPVGQTYHSYWYSDTTIEIKYLGFRYFPEFHAKRYPLQQLSCGEEVLELVRDFPTDQQIDCALSARFYSILAAIVPYMQYHTSNIGALIVEKAKDYMMENVHQSIAQIAKHCGVSEAVLYKYFQQVREITPNTLRQQILCEKAVSMLTNTDCSVQQISDTLHFSSTSYFRKILYKHTGMTPRQIRQTAHNI